MLSKVLTILVLTCVFLIVRSAPIVKENKDNSLADRGSSVQVKSSDEEQLHNLKGKLPEVTKQGLAVVKTETISESIVNGEKETSSDVETKVLKPDTNKVVADVELSSQGHQNGNEAPKIESEVDIPDQGIVQKFQGFGYDGVPARNPMAFTPKAVAEYLLVSGDLDGFFSALQELVSAKVMSVTDAKSYEMAVEQEYQMLLMELEQPDDADYYNSLNFNREDKRGDVLEDDMGTFNIDAMTRRAELQNAIEKEEAYAELAQALVNDYIKESDEPEEEAYDDMMGDMDTEEVDNVIGLLADALVTDELAQESQNVALQPELTTEDSDSSDEEELDQIAHSMGQIQEVPEAKESEGTEAEMGDYTEKKSRTSSEAKEIDDKKAKKSEDETVPAKKAE